MGEDDVSEKFKRKPSSEAEFETENKEEDAPDDCVNRPDEESWEKQLLIFIPDTIEEEGRGEEECSSGRGLYY